MRDRRSSEWNQAFCIMIIAMSKCSVYHVLHRYRQTVLLAVVKRRLADKLLECSVSKPSTLKCNETLEQRSKREVLHV